MLIVAIFLYVYCIEPMQIYAAALDTPLNLLEPFISITNSVYAAPLLPLLFLFLISSFPCLDQSSGFILFRIGRTNWFLGQILFIGCAGLTYLSIILLFSVLVVCKDAFLANGWSLAVRRIYDPSNLDLFRQAGLAQINLSVLNQFRPYPAAIFSFLLMWSYIVVTGTVLMLFAVRGKKVIGFFFNVLSNAVGTVLVVMNSSIMWIFPSAHIMLANHYDESLNITYFDIEYSFLYSFILLVIVMWLAYKSIKTCSFHTIDVTED
jgi:hypothetical protein